MNIMITQKMENARTIYVIHKTKGCADGISLFNHTANYVYPFFNFYFVSSANT